MADPRYEIDWAPPNLGPAIQLFQAARNAHKQNDRADEYAAMEKQAIADRSVRESNAEKRAQDALEHQRAVEAFAQAPLLMRAAANSFKTTGGPGYAGNNPYGIKFDVAQGQAPSLRSSGINVMGGNDQYAQHAAQTLGGPAAPEMMPQTPDVTLPQGYEGPEADPTAEAARFAHDESEPVHGPAEEATEVPSPGVAAAQMLLGQHPASKLYANFGGQRFEVPQQSERTPFGHEYDAIYQGLLDTGEDPHKAMQFVATQYKADQTQENIAKRTAANTAALIAGRDTSREDEQAFRERQDAQYRRTFEQAMALARAAAQQRDPSGGTSPETMAALADYAIKNPGDVGGLYREADRLHAPSPGKAVPTISGATKPTESQTKDAKQAAIGLRAVTAIERSGYTPSRDEVQKWLNNQRLTHGATEGGVKGLALTLGQSMGVAPQSEVEGLSPHAQEYFANVRRFMETIGRAQSGAAISPTEWENFFNQYGPNSSGGIGAARQYLEDQLKVSGVAGRSLGPSAGRHGGPPAAAPTKVVNGVTYEKVPGGWQRVQ
jgi:hypothetical protein